MEISSEPKDRFIDFGAFAESKRPELKTDKPYFAFIVQGNFQEGKVRIITTNEKRADHYSPEVNELIDQEWDRRLEEAKANNRVLFNSPQLGLESFSVTSDGQLIIKAYETSYKEYVGLRYHQELPFTEQANPIAVGSLIVLKDGIIIPQRSEKVEYLPLALDFPAGWPTKEEVQTGKFMDNPFVSAYRELLEEAGIKPDEAKLACRGIILENHAIHPLLLFTAESPLSKADVMQRKNDEESNIDFIDKTPEATRETILRKQVYSIPPVAAALYDYGVRNFGETWKNEIDLKFKRLTYLLNTHIGTERKLKGLRVNKFKRSSKEA